MERHIAIGVVILVGAAISYAWRNPSPASFRHWRIAQADGHARFELISSLGGKVQHGTGKAEVARLLGMPDNSDNDFVWYWCCDAASRQVNHTWGKLSRYGRGPAAYLLFDKDGRMMHRGLLKGAEGSPWDAYCGFLTCEPWRFGRARAEEYTESLLGPHPYSDLYAARRDDIPRSIAIELIEIDVGQIGGSPVAHPP